MHPQQRPASFPPPPAQPLLPPLNTQWTLLPTLPYGVVCLGVRVFSSSPLGEQISISLP